MRRNIIAAAAVALLWVAHANAATVTLLAPAAVAEGESFEIRVVGDFAVEGLAAGGLQMLFDPAVVRIDEFQFSLAVDPAFSCPGAVLCPDAPAGTFSIVWGVFPPPDLIAPGTGPTEMARLTVTALAATPGTTLSLIDFSSFTSGWYGSGFNAIAVPELVGAFLQIDADTVPDADFDGVPDSADNCTIVANPDQRDVNADGFGNACDADLNEDCIVNAVDLGLFRQVFFSTDPEADLNGDGVVNPVDLGILKALFFMPPGPAAEPNSCVP